MRGVAGLALALLAGCTGIAVTGGPPMPRLALYDGAVIAAAGTNYCVDPRVSRPGQGFAVLAACRTITGTGDMPFLNGVITVQAGEAGTATVAADSDGLIAFLQSADGAALLSDSGRADLIRVRSVRRVGSSVVVHFDDSDPGKLRGTQSSQWRAFLDISGRLVTVSLRGPAQAPLSPDAGEQLIGQALRGLQQANGRVS